MAIIAGYALISQNFVVMPYLMVSQGAMLLIMGVDETKEERKKSGIFLIAGSLFSFYVGFSIFFKLNFQFVLIRNKSNPIAGTLTLMIG